LTKYGTWRSSAEKPLSQVAEKSRATTAIRSMKCSMGRLAEENKTMVKPLKRERRLVIMKAFKLTLFEVGRIDDTWWVNALGVEDVFESQRSLFYVERSEDGWLFDFLWLGLFAFDFRNDIDQW
jgi:hypothetical protein